MNQFDLRHYLPAGSTISLPIDDYEILIRNAIQLERKRIIKLLEADCREGLGDHIQGCSHEVAIALIKGEQNG